ncbi:MAG: hypothetical protein ACR2H1_07165, partial [Limisphaerales bacterium]
MPLNKLFFSRESFQKGWCIVTFIFGMGLSSICAEEIRPDLDYFPSPLHAAIFRNWDIVPLERVAAVLGTDLATLRNAGKTLGLSWPKPLSTEEIRRNVEIVLRRNWALLPRSQIEFLLDYSPKELDEFLSKEIFLRALLANPPADLTLLKYEKPNQQTEARVKWFGAHVSQHLKAVGSTPEEPRLAFTNELCRAHNPADFIAGSQPSDREADLRTNWTIQVSENPGALTKIAVQDFCDYCQQIQRAEIIQVETKTQAPGKKSFFLSLDSTLKKPETYALNISSQKIVLRGASELGLARGLVELERRMAERGGPFLSSTKETNSPSFSPRYVSSYFS